MSVSAHRKVVTVLFCDVVGSTALGESVDPEALQGLLARYFERMKGIVESHGGSVEKFIGDAVMAVFGVPVVHEDDALRACRAAVEMRDALPELGVESRIGVNTGEVLTGTEERLATGDAVNVAARLEQAAEAGEVLLGAQTLRLVAPAVEVGEERLLELKGKSEPVAAHPLLAVQEAPERSHASRFIGRERELAKLVDAWERALAGPGCQLVTVVGDAGVGKSRLVAEALDSLDARVVRGRCLPYGEGITYWPVIEVVKQLAALPSDPAAAVAVRSLLGESDQGTSADQIAWAFRKLLVEQAPLVVVLDDIQWGEETFLDLVEAAALLTGDAPILLLCMARPELLERHPAWPGTLRLEPLSDDEADQLIRQEVTGELQERIAQAAGGNPLFISEMLAMAREEEDVEVPPTLKALLAVRLDQLDEPERRVLERGSVEGELFHRGAVQALAPEEPQVAARLTALVRRELVRPGRAQLAGDDGVRFRHLLIRAAAYDPLPKSVRAELHERFADWLVSHTELVELDEIVGYHLEQAVGYRRELGKPVEELAERAAERLAASGRRALWREDRRALEHARLAGQQRTGLFWIELALGLGPTPAAEALAQLDELLPATPWPFSLFTRAWLLAMLDRFDEAVPLARDSNERLRELDGRRIGEIRLAEIARMAGDHQAAAGHLQTLCAWLEEREQYGLLGTYVCLLGRELCALGRFDEAEALARRGRELAADDNIDSGLWRQVQARVLAHRGEHSEAERLAREAVARVEESDNLPWQGDAWCELAEVLEAAGRRDAAIDAWREAHDRYERKGIIPLARRVRERLAAAQPTQA